MSLKIVKNFPLAASPRAVKYGVRQERTTAGETAASMAKRLRVPIDLLISANPHIFGRMKGKSHEAVVQLMQWPVRPNLVVLVPRVAVKKPAGVGDDGFLSTDEEAACIEAQGIWSGGQCIAAAEPLPIPNPGQTQPTPRGGGGAPAPRSSGGGSGSTPPPTTAMPAATKGVPTYVKWGVGLIAAAATVAGGAYVIAKKSKKQSKKH